MTGWLSTLSGSNAHGSELDWLGHAGDRVRSELGEGALSWAVEAGERLAQEVTSMVQGEGAHYNALRRATTDTVLRVLLLVGGAQIELWGPENREIARDFARRGVSLDDMVRSMRRGFSLMAQMLLDAAEKWQGGDQTEVKRVALLLFSHLDGFLDLASAEYRRENVDYQTTVTAARLDTVQKILGDDSTVDVDSASQVLNYPVDAPWHVAAVAWTPQPDYSTTLRATIDRLFGSLGLTGRSLILPVGSHVMWSWIALAQRPRFEDVAGFQPTQDGRVALGDPAPGPEGFRRSHREARAVENLVRRRATAPAVLSFGEVELAALLTRDQVAARDMVDRHLGALAERSPRMEELRRTLRCYLAFERSISRVASELHISRNTVTYRVQQAMRLSGHDGDDSSLLLHAALSIVDWLD